MCRSSESYPAVRLVKLVVRGLLVGCALASADNSFSQSPELPVLPQSMNWRIGPASATLADVADLEIPRGFQFLDAPGTRMFLKDTHRAEPKGLVGLITAASADWYIVFSWSDMGYVADTDRSSLNEDSMLKAIFWMENQSLAKQ